MSTFNETLDGMMSCQNSDPVVRAKIALPAINNFEVHGNITDILLHVLSKKESIAFNAFFVNGLLVVRDKIGAFYNVYQKVYTSPHESAVFHYVFIGNDCMRLNNSTSAFEDLIMFAAANVLS